MKADAKKALKGAAAIAVVWFIAAIAIPQIKEKVELKRRKEVCEEYLAQTDISLGFSVEFDIVWEEEVYGRDDYEIRNIYPENATEEDLKILGQLLDSLEYDPDISINKTTETPDGCGEYPMRIEVACCNGNHILLTWSFGGEECLLSAYDEDGKWLAHGGYRADAEAANAFRALGGLPPIPTIEQVIGRE